MIRTLLAKFIRTAETGNTGGNCMADVFELKSGGTVFVTDEMIGFAPGTTWHDGPSEDYRGLPFDVVGCVARADDGESSELGLTFVKSLKVYEPDGPVSVDLLTLFDGRVLGIDADSAVLYPSMEAFDKLGEDSEKDSTYPSMDLADESDDVEREIRITWNEGVARHASGVSIIRCSQAHLEDVIDLCEIALPNNDNGTYEVVAAMGPSPTALLEEIRAKLKEVDVDHVFGIPLSRIEAALGRQA